MFANVCYAKKASATKSESVGSCYWSILMREFGIPFKGLHRGLRRFPVSQRGEDWLFECHNLMPTEVGLVAHEVVIDINAGVSLLLLETGDRVLLESSDFIVIG